jgi:hypothetical protein
MFHCTRCFRYLDRAERGPNGRVLCEGCRDDLAAADRKRRVTGRQPSVCEHCRQPFTAGRRGQRFCSDAHRAAAWRAGRQMAA